MAASVDSSTPRLKEQSCCTIKSTMSPRYLERAPKRRMIGKRPSATWRAMRLNNHDHELFDVSDVPQPLLGSGTPVRKRARCAAEGCAGNMQGLNGAEPQAG